MRNTLGAGGKYVLCKTLTQGFHILAYCKVIADDKILNFEVIHRSGIPRHHHPYSSTTDADCCAVLYPYCCK